MDVQSCESIIKPETILPMLTLQCCWCSISSIVSVSVFYLRVSVVCKHVRVATKSFGATVDESSIERDEGEAV